MSDPSELAYLCLKSRESALPGSFQQSAIDVQQLFASVSSADGDAAGSRRKRKNGVRKRKASNPMMDFTALTSGSLKEMEERHSIRNVWGTTTTPALHALECIQHVKHCLTDMPEDDSISTAAFAWLLGISFTSMVAILMVWELHLRPKSII